MTAEPLTRTDPLARPTPAPPPAAEVRGRDPRLTEHDAAPVKTATAARQGRSLHTVRYVLIVGLVLVVAAFVAIYFLMPPR